MAIIHMILLCAMVNPNPNNVHDFSYVNMEGEKVSLDSYAGKYLLIVNTASKCGFTKQYKELQELSEKYKDKLVVIGFPANNFGGQEPGSNEQITEFCEVNFGVTFPLSQKVDVLGKEIDPLFGYLTQAENADFKGDIKWNFEKFLINPQGELIRRYRSKVTPLDTEITKEFK